MSRLFFSGFENAAVNSANSGKESWISNTSDLSADTTIVRSGTYSMKANGNGGGFVYKQFVSSAGNGPYYFRFYLRVTSAPNVRNGIASVNNAGSTSELQIYLNTNRTIEFCQDGSTPIGSASGTLNTNQWYRVEIEADATGGAGAGIAKWYLDGTLMGSLTNHTYAGGMARLLLGMAMFSESLTSGTWYFDDVAINDSSGSFENGLPGPGSIEALRPNANGDNNDFLDGTNSSNYAEIDEVTADDATTYVHISSPSVGDIIDVNVTDPPASISDDATIKVVAVGARKRGDSAGSAVTTRLRIKASSGGTVEESSDITLDSASYFTNSLSEPTNYPLTLYDLPGASTTAWTKADLATAQIGERVTAVDGLDDVYTSQLWMMVEYDNPSSDYEQEGFRWRDDDGDEDGATWLQAQDTDITREIETNTRLRLLLNTTGDPSPVAFMLQFKKSTDSEWLEVGNFNYPDVTPTIVSIGKGATTTSNTTSHDITMPATFAAGDQLLIIFSADQAPDCTISSGGWTRIAQSSQASNVTQAIFTKTAAGGDTATVTTSTSEQSSHIVYAFRDAGTIIAAPGASGNSINADPPSFNVGATRNRLWIAATSSDSTVVASAAPGTYTNLQTQAAAGTGGASTSSAQLASDIGVQDPGSFTTTTEQWVATTIAVPPYGYDLGMETQTDPTGSNDASFGNYAWSNPTNISASNDTTATATTPGSPNGTQPSNYLKALDFGFAIPGTATVGSVAVGIERLRSGGTTGAIRDNVIKLVKGGTVSGNNNADTATNWPTTVGGVVREYDADWGVSLTPSDVNGSTFGCVLAIAGSGSTTNRVAEVDNIYIRVVYETVALRTLAFDLASSTNITDGEATTFQITAPSGKSTSDFAAGEMYDVSNPSNSLNLGSDEYTELEWCIQATSDAEDGETYDFRVVYSDGTELETYSVTPQWTIGTAGGTETAGVAPVTATFSIPSTTATYDEVYSAGVAPVTATLTSTATTATYSEVETAGVAPTTASLVVTSLTATYEAVLSAVVAPVVATIAVVALAATYVYVTTASVAPVTETFSVHTTTATYVYEQTAGVAPVTGTLSVTATAATYSQSATASVAPVTATLSVTSTDATYVYEQTADVSPVTATFSITSTTASYVQVETAAVDPVTATFTLPAVTATYDEGSLAEVVPVVLTATVTATTATYEEVDSASVAPVIATLSLPSTTATYDEIDTASVAPVTGTFSVTTTVATYVYEQTASVDPVVATLVVPSVTAESDQIEVADVSPVVATLVVPALSADYVQVETASVAPATATFIVPAVSATYDSQADVTPVTITATIPNVTATYHEAAAVAPVVITTTIPPVAASYDEIETASVAPVSATFSIPPVTASGVFIAQASPVSMTLVIPSVSAIGTYPVSLAPVSMTLTVTPLIPSFTVPASVAPVALQLTVPEVRPRVHPWYLNDPQDWEDADSGPWYDDDPQSWQGAQGGNWYNRNNTDWEDANG